MSLPVLTFADKQEIAARYGDGESMPALAESYGCVVSVIDRALVQMGVGKRSAKDAALLVKAGQRDDALTRCRECGAGCDPNAVRPLCTACVLLFCQDCDERLPAGRRTRLCADCKCRARYQKKEPRLCRVCGRMASKGSRRLLCGVHRRWFCSACDGPIPPTRINPRCTKCEQDRKLILWAKGGRRCSQCGEAEAKVHSTRCQHCLHEEYEVRRWALMHLDRPCVECGATLPKGRRLPRCVVCQRKVERRRRKERLAAGCHRCAMCHDPLALRHATYCPGCNGMLHRWRAAWHAGNAVARAMGTVRVQQRRWQADSPPASGAAQ